MTTALAPGKIILSGEHAVVHGAPALVTAVEAHASATATPQPNGITLQAPFGERNWETGEDLQRLLDSARSRLAAFHEGKRPIEQVLEDPAEFVGICLALAPRPASGIHLTIKTSLPLGAGMGSSAAVAAASLLALDTPSHELYDRVLDAERFQHGTPSGVDPYAAVHGGALRFQRDQEPVPLDIPPLSLILVNTGRPSATTGECVSQVQAAFNDPGRVADFASACASIEQALTAENEAALIDAVRENHRLLTAIGVVPPPVQEWIALIESSGAAAKVCGAGSIRGKAAGMVWVVGEVPQILWDACPYARLVMQGGQPGARIVG